MSFFDCQAPLASLEVCHVSESDLFHCLGILRPKACPFPLIRIGGNTDGAYLLPNDLEGITDCFSPGVNNTKAFEDELTARYNIRCHMCDASSDEDRFATPLISGMQTFMKAWLEPKEDAGCICLENWLLDMLSNDSQDLILQMDIEGAEYRNLLELSVEALSRFRILVIEFHDLHRLAEPLIYWRCVRPVLDKISLAFTCVHAHQNNYSAARSLPGVGPMMPPFLELTFLRNDRFPDDSVSAFYPVSLPHSLDILNVKDRKPQFLDKSWSGGKRQPSSVLKMLIETSSYYLGRSRTKAAIGLRKAWKASWSELDRKTDP